MRQGLKFGIFISLLIIGVTFMDEISIFSTKIIYSYQVTEFQANEYALDQEVQFVSEATDFEADYYQELLDILYTFFNYGYDSMTFYCNVSEYPDCVNNVLSIANDSIFVTDISNFAHPFNTHSKITVVTNIYGKIELTINKNYSDDDIERIMLKVREIITEVITDDMTDREKIKAIHDYIIDNTSYDQEFLKGDSPYHSSTAIGPLFEGKGICSGYTDLMAIFLNELNMNNYRISSDDHVWNLVEIAGDWLHLDLTWDDPIVNGGTSEVILDDYFLISIDELEEMDLTEHSFNKAVYIEGS